MPGSFAYSTQQRERRAARAAPVPVPDGVVVATIGDSLYLLDIVTGTVRARMATPGTVLGTPATDGRHVYCATTAGRLLSLELPGLIVAWDRPLGDAVYGAPALVRDTLYVLTANGTLWRIPVADPEQARSTAFRVPATAGPTPLAGGILIGGTSGEVILVDAATDSIRWRMHVRGPIEEPPVVRNRQLILVSGGGAVEAFQ
jgi:outer membrane protein assembly factor BamB